jgi:hypothetical protein
MMNERLAGQIIEGLRRRRPQAAFVSEVASTIQPSPMAMQLEATLRDLQVGRQILIVDHSAPDVHLVGTDLRVVAWLPGEDDESAALDATEAHWNSWLREFLATHRCQ